MPQLMSDFHDLLDRRHGAEDVRELRDGDELGFRRQRLFEFIERKIAFVIDIDPSQHRAFALAQEMPRHDIGMMLHFERTISSPSLEKCWA